MTGYCSELVTRLCADRSCLHCNLPAAVLCCPQKHADMERMWQQVVEEARKESESALRAAASRQQELNAARDELRHAQDRITELTALEANWRRRAEAAQQQV